VAKLGVFREGKFGNSGDKNVNIPSVGMATPERKCSAGVGSSQVFAYVFCGPSCLTA